MWGRAEVVVKEDGEEAGKEGYDRERDIYMSNVSLMSFKIIQVHV